MISRRKLFGFLAATPALPLAAMAESKSEDIPTRLHFGAGDRKTRQVMVKPDGSLYLASEEVTHESNIGLMINP